VKISRRVAAIAGFAMAAAALAIAPVAAQDTTTTTATPKKPIKVKVDDNVYKPKKLVVYVGDTVQWKWVGSANHDVVVKKGPEKFKSKLKGKGKFTRTLSVPGKYRIHCTIHPGMEMKLTVKDLPTTTTAPPPPAT
jgi:plastocyanin